MIIGIFIKREYNVGKIMKRSKKMKLKKILITFIALISLIAIGNVNVSSVQAKQEKVSVKVFPKKMRGTWYQIDDLTGRLTKTTYTKNKIISYYNGKKGIRYLHVKTKGEPNWDNRDSKKEDWVYMYPGVTKFQAHKWITYYGWYQMSAAPYFNVSKINGHQVLTNEYGVYPKGANHYYRTAKLAKKLKNRHYAHFVY